MKILKQLASFIVVLVVAVSHRPLQAQEFDKIIKSIPADDGCFIWLDDAKGTLKNLNQAGLLPFDLWLNKVSAHAEKLDDDELRGVIERLQRDLVDDPLPTGDLLVHWKTASYLGGDTYAIIARCDQDETTLNRFIRDANQLASVLSKLNVSVASAANMKQPSGHWSRTGPFLCWSNTSERLDEVTDSLSKDKLPKDSLFGNRVLVRSFSHLNPADNDIRVFATSDFIDQMLLRSLGWSGANVLVVATGNSEGLLGVGASIRTSRKHDDDATICVVEIESHVALSSPEHGFSVALHPTSPLDYSLDFSGFPVTHYLQLQTDVEPFLKDMREHLEFKLGDQAEKLIDTHLLSLDRRRILGGLMYRPNKLRRLAFASFVNHGRAFAFDREREADDVTNEVDAAMAPEPDFDGYELNQIDIGHKTAWQLGDGAAEKLLQHHIKLARDHMLSTSMVDLHFERNPDETMEDYRQNVELTLDAQVPFLHKAYEDQCNCLATFADPWVIAWHPFYGETVRDLVANQQPNRQIAELKARVGKLKKRYGLQNDELGVFSWWSQPEAIPLRYQNWDPQFRETSSLTDGIAAAKIDSALWVLTRESSTGLSLVGTLTFMHEEGQQNSDQDAEVKD